MIDIDRGIIYLDNGATTWPKPAEVGEAMVRALEYGGNPGRGAHAMALETSRAIFEERRRIATFLGVADPKNLLFQPGATQAANLVLRGSLHPGDRVIVSATEHNSVTRPLAWLQRLGVEVVQAPHDDWGVIDLEAVEAMLASKTATAVVCQHASNLSGAVQPVADLVDLAHDAGARIIIDGAQAGGHLAIDLKALDADAWFCSGHKGLLGPQGLGLLYLKPGFDVEPLVWGGTGSGGPDTVEGPYERPDAFEAGTQALPLILGLGAAVGVLVHRADTFREHERRLAVRLHEGLAALDSIEVLGPPVGAPRVPLVSIVSDRIASDQIAFELDRRWNIACRAGLHCAPAAHRALGTEATGAVRFGVGPYNTDEQIDTVISAVATLVDEAR